MHDHRYWGKRGPVRNEFSYKEPWPVNDNVKKAIFSPSFLVIACTDQNRSVKVEPQHYSAGYLCNKLTYLWKNVLTRPQ